MASNSKSYCLSLPSDGITGMRHYTQPSILITEFFGPSLNIASMTRTLSWCLNEVPEKNSPNLGLEKGVPTL
jgi:hypothetical protein